MPVRRIKCRCGQEHVLRVGEWVYVLRGLFVLSVFLNVGAGFLMVVLLSESPDSTDEQSLSPDGSAARLAVGDSVVEGVEVASPAPSAAGAPVDARMPVPAPLTLGTDPPAAAARQPEPETAAVAAPEPRRADSDKVEDSERLKASSGSEELVSAEDVVSKISMRDMLERPTPEVPDEAPRNGAAEDEVASPETANFRVVAEMSAFERLLVLALAARRSESSAMDAPDTELLAALVHDPDGVVRRAAMGRLVKTLQRWTPAAAPSAAVRPWLDAAAAWIRHEPSGESLRPWLSEDPVAVDLPWETVAEIARRRSAELDGLASLHMPDLRNKSLDVVLLVDVTESMANSFTGLRSGVRWLLPALRWVVPGARTGLLFYRDEVAQVSGFGATVDEQIAILEGQDVRGGGDVPEGVTTAIRSALQLGRFSWRDGVRKVLIVIGDGPPPFKDIRGTLSLVRLARAEAGFRLHVLIPETADGRSTQPFFDDLARAGAGRFSTTSASDLPCSILQAVLPSECAELVTTACAELRR